MAKKESDCCSGQMEVLRDYKRQASSNNGTPMDSNVGEYQTPSDPKSTNR